MYLIGRLNRETLGDWKGYLWNTPLLCPTILVTSTLSKFKSTTPTSLKQNSIILPDVIIPCESRENCPTIMNLQLLAPKQDHWSPPTNTSYFMINILVSGSIYAFHNTSVFLHWSWTWHLMTICFPAYSQKVIVMHQNCSYYCTVRWRVKFCHKVQFKRSERCRQEDSVININTVDKHHLVGKVSLANAQVSEWVSQGNYSLYVTVISG